MGTGSIGRRSTAVPRPQKKASAWLVGESCSCPRLLDGSLGLVVAGAAATGVLVTGVVMTGGTTSVVPGDGAARGGPYGPVLKGRMVSEGRVHTLAGTVLPATDFATGSVHVTAVEYCLLDEFEKIVHDVRVVPVHAFISIDADRCLVAGGT